MDPNPYALQYWIGESVGALIPMLSSDCIWVTIRNVEAGGIWIECEQLTIGFCKGKSEPDEFDDTGKVVAFIPYSQITYIATLDLKTLRRARLLKFSDKPAGEPGSAESPQHENPQSKEM